MSGPERPVGRCIGCRAPGGGFCGGCGADLRDDKWDGKSRPPHTLAAPTPFERGVTALMKDSGLPTWGPHRRTVERRQRIFLEAFGGQGE